MSVSSIPIYKGGSKINEEFNSKSFVNFYDFNSEKDMIDYIIELDKDDNKYLEMLKQPWFIDYNIPDNNKIDNIKSFLYKIFN
jgi:hypothetical protein